MDLMPRPFYAYLFAPGQLLAALLLLGTPLLSLAQYGPVPEQAESLRTLARQWHRRDSIARLQARQFLRQRGMPVRFQDRAQTLEVQRLGPNGLPQYYITQNAVAAASVQTDQLWPGGGSALNLTGDSLMIGEWDGGAVRGDHIELQGRVTQGDTPNDTSDHATHVGGTLMAAGLDSAARGMAYQALLEAYDWTSDNSEMASAAAKGLLISNHSYGFVTGWRYSGGADQWRWYGDTSISQQEDYRFGRYSDQARDWDEIVYKAPYYLPVKSAGNDRNDELPADVDTHYVRGPQGQWQPSTRQRPGDGPYDCLPAKANAKNILTVGAVKDLPNGYQGPGSVAMTSFSSWGPTDDGRIKPDIVGNGRGLYSTESDDTAAYGKKSGTSMSAPNVAGSLLLLQELYQRKHGSFMKASTLKSLALHTAYDAGPAGPDYSYGWGLLNMREAAEVIQRDTSEHRLVEASLANQDTFTLQVYNNGCKPLRATIAWTDPPGPAQSKQLDPKTLALVNDLDLRIIHNKQISKPYKMNPNQPSQAAGRGDNIRDNVEQVLVSNPQAGWYTLRVTHKGSLHDTSSQDFALITSGLGGQPIATQLPADTGICPGDTAQLTAKPAGGQPPYQQQWQKSPAAGPSVQVTKPGPYIYEVFDARNCRQVDTVRVRTEPAITLRGDTSICQQDTLTLSSGYPNGDNLWSTGDTLSQIQVSDKGLYWVNVTTQQGCTNRDSILVQFVDQQPKPTIEVNGDTEICEGEKLLLDAGPGRQAYQWNTGADERAIFVDEGGTYQVTVTDACEKQTAAPVTITAHERPRQPSIARQGNQLVATPAQGYQWFYQQQAIPGATSQQLQPQQAGNYSVRVSNAFGCTAQSVPVYYEASTARTPALAAAGTLQLAPNPVTHTLQIALPEAAAPAKGRPMRYSILNAQGQRIRAGQLPPAGTQQQRQLPVRELAAGLYILRLNTPAGPRQARFMKR